MAKEGKTSIFKVILIFMFVFTVIPLGISALIYNTNDTFKETANNFLRERPGIIGDYFSKYPTKKERSEKLDYIIEHYKGLDKATIADKLYIIKKDDEKLYHDLIQEMKGEALIDIEEVVKNVRDLEMRKDIVVSIYNEIESEKRLNFENDVKRFEKMDTYLCIKEIEDRYINGKEDIEDLVVIFNNIKGKNAAEILYFLGNDSRTKILDKLNTLKSRDLRAILREKEIKEEEINVLAKIYENKDSVEAFKEIGNTDNYDINDLAQMYSNMSIKSAAEILSHSSDKEFIDELFTKIRVNERLKDKEESITVEINDLLNYLNDYDKKINELVSLYEKMDPKAAAEVVSKMIINEYGIKYYDINENEQYKISDASIIMDVLKRMNKSTLTKILSNLELRKVTEITRRLAL